MKKSTILLAFVSLMLACSQEDKFDNYTIFVRNISSHNFDLFTYSDGSLIDNVQIESGERDLMCKYKSSYFAGYDLCGIDSMRIVFPNGKGYICANILEDEFCYGNQINPYVFNEKFINTNGETYEFTITQQDFENAFDLE